MPRPEPLMIFAAGLGTRMGELTRTRPKPLIPVAGRALIDHALLLAETAQANPIVVNLHYFPDLIRAHLSNRSNILYSLENERILETGGGLRKALPLLGPGPVMTLNADAVWTGPNPLVMLGRAWNPERMDALVALVPRERAAGHLGCGDFMMDAEGRLCRGPGLVYTGAQILKPERLQCIEAEVFSLNRVWDDIAADGRLFGVVHGGGWCDVGHPEAIPVAEALLAGGGDA